MAGSVVSQQITAGFGFAIRFADLADFTSLDRVLSCSRAEEVEKRAAGNLEWTWIREIIGSLQGLVS